MVTTHKKATVVIELGINLLLIVDILLPATVASVNRSTIGIDSLKKSFKMTFRYCHWLVPIYNQYTVLFYTSCLKCHVTT